jgi:hypothetical protein
MTVENLREEGDEGSEGEGHVEGPTRSLSQAAIAPVMIITRST